MARVESHVCDRCRRSFDEVRLGMTVTVNYHHPAKLELCEDCHGALTMWLGHHALFGTPVDRILAGLATGDGYPSREWLQIYRRERGLPPWCPICVREGKNPPGEYVDSSPGGTETWTCGHAIGK